MLQPKKTKYRKAFKGRIHGSAKGGFSLNFGSYGLKTLEPERITARQIEAARRAITRQMKRQGRVWIARELEIAAHGARQIGDVEIQAALDLGIEDVRRDATVRIDQIGLARQLAREALRLGAAKLPVRTKVVTRIDAGIAQVEEAA